MIAVGDPQLVSTRSATSSHPPARAEPGADGAARGRQLTYVTRNAVARSPRGAAAVGAATQDAGQALQEGSQRRLDDRRFEVVPVVVQEVGLGAHLGAVDQPLVVDPQLPRRSRRAVDEQRHDAGVDVGDNVPRRRSAARPGACSTRCRRGVDVGAVAGDELPRLWGRHGSPGFVSARVVACALFGRPGMTAVAGMSCSCRAGSSLSQQWRRAASDKDLTTSGRHAGGWFFTRPSQLSLVATLTPMSPRMAPPNWTMAWWGSKGRSTMPRRAPKLPVRNSTRPSAAVPQPRRLRQVRAALALGRGAWRGGYAGGGRVSYGPTSTGSPRSSAGSSAGPVNGGRQARSVRCHGRRMSSQAVSANSVATTAHCEPVSCR